MFSHQWLRKVFPQSHHPAPPSRRRRMVHRRIFLEQLEDRRLLTTAGIHGIVFEDLNADGFF